MQWVFSAHSRGEELAGGLSQVGFYVFPIGAILCYRTVRYICRDSVTNVVRRFYQHGVLIFFPSRTRCRYILGDPLELSTRDFELRRVAVLP